MLEGGYNYRTMVCKGLELEETSCHATEITQVDDLCALAFDQSDDRIKTSKLVSIVKQSLVKYNLNSW